MWELIEKISWKNHEVYAEKKSGIIRVLLRIDGKIYSGYSTGDDISSANIPNALLDLQRVLEKHANGEYIDFAVNHYSLDELVKSQHTCKSLF